MPGAEITEIVDDTTYRAKVKVKIGPLGMSYRATVVIEMMDDGERIATIRIDGDDIKGAGGIKATVVSRAHERNGVTHVQLSTEAQVAGVIAKLGGKLIEAAARGFVAEFAGNLGKIVTPPVASRDEQPR
jgi:carbon monoxide dehydrogenase subunit G